MKPNEKFMTMAIDKARDGVDCGQTPFGACIVKEGEIVSCEHNIVWQSCDITAHAEINAIRVACKQLNTIDLSGCVIYSTCEPCPMCFSACHWASLEKIVYGASIADAATVGFSELAISNQQMKDIGQSSIEIVAGFMQADCVALFADWMKKADRKIY